VAAKVIVVGAGPSGVQACHQLRARGLDVQLIDFGVTSGHAAGADSERRGFVEFREREVEQSPLLWGPAYSDFPFANRKGGAGLTPPRAFATEHVAEWLPLRTDGIVPVESLAKGGLGEAWGLGAFVLATPELEAMGLPAAAIRESYGRVCARIGVSGVDIAESLQPLDLDESAERLWERSRAREGALARLGLRVSRTPLALLSQPYDGRSATPYTDMDFYQNPGTSAYRPGFDVDRLRERHGVDYVSGWLVTTVRETADGVEVTAVSRADRTSRVFTADSVVLAAGALGSARIALRSGLARQSDGAPASRVPLMCSPYAQIVAVQPALVGRVLRDRRHSMGQLVMALEDASDPSVVPLASILSYRSLLLTRLMREAPLPVRQSRAFFHALQSGLVIAGVFFPQKLADAEAQGWLEPDAASPTGDRFVLENRSRGDARRAEARVLATYRTGLRALGAVPLRTVRLQTGASIHYGGTLPFGVSTDAATGRLAGCRRIFVGDGSPFHMVPGRGITLTLMAYADWVAERVAEGA